MVGPQMQGANVVKHDHDQYILIKAQLLDLLDTLRFTTYEASPVQFLLRLEQIREHAASRGLGAIAEIAATFEAALQHVGDRGGSGMVSESFCAILEDAIGVAHVHPNASEALLASVAIRLGN
jgi:hypothetical protein